MPRHVSFFIAAVLLSVPSAADAQTELRWDLKAGQKFVVEMDQQTKSVVSYAGQSAATDIHLQMRLDWEVIASEAGKMQIRQSVSRVAMTLDSETAGRLEYDSAAASPAGRSRELAAAVAPLLNATVEMTMNQRGEVLEAAFTGEAVEKIMLSGQGGAVKATKDKIEKLLQQALLVLPENAVKADETWTDEVNLVTALGPARQKTTYRYGGQITEEGQSIEKIQSSATLAVTGKNDKQMALKSHEQNGGYWFSAAAGRLVKGEQNEKLVTERPFRGTTIEVTLESKQVTTIRPKEPG